MLFLGTPPDRASPSTSPRNALPDHVNGRALPATREKRPACAGSLLISRLGRPEIAPSRGWRRLHAFSLSRYRLSFEKRLSSRNDAASLPIVFPSALLARVSPSSVDRTPRDESLGNAGGSTDALRHPVSPRGRWKTSREHETESRSHAPPLPRRSGRDATPKRLSLSFPALAWALARRFDQ